MRELLGWASSIVLVLTITRQVHTQWRAKTSRGLSRWLYVGQLAASVGFTVYSALLRNWVFVVTNGLLALAAVTGLAIYLKNKRRDEGRVRVGATEPWLVAQRA